MQKVEVLWETIRYVPGWIFEGAERCIELAKDKHEKKLQSLKEMSRVGRLYFKSLLSVMGKSRHATIGIPAAKGIFAPVNLVLGREPSWLNVEKYTSVRKSVDGMRQLLQEAALEPTKCTEPIPGNPE